MPSPAASIMAMSLAPSPTANVAASGKVRVVTETYRLDEIGKAYERVEKGQVRFRAVVTM